MSPHHEGLFLVQNLLRRQSLQVAAAILLLMLLARHFISEPNKDVASRLAEPGTAYRGKLWHNERTVAVETLGETKFARCDVMGEDGKSLINDWIFLEEVSAVNIVVQMLDGRFVVFKQNKYGIPGETLSPVGGFIDEGESPLTAAKREVLEELGLGSRRTRQTVSSESKKSVDPGETLDLETVAKIIVEKGNSPVLDEFGLLDGLASEVPTLEFDADWIFLGKYRTAANRGGGFLYSYLLKSAVPLIPGGGTLNYEGTGDGESQTILFLSEEEVFKALSRGQFQEVKWTATFSLAILNLKDDMPACCG
ncbi:hypothetical protein ACHAXR_011883 [Thalassiosira sp. AJA248-18]